MGGAGGLPDCIRLLSTAIDWGGGWVAFFMAMEMV